MKRWTLILLGLCFVNIVIGQFNYKENRLIVKLKRGTTFKKNTRNLERFEIDIIDSLNKVHGVEYIIKLSPLSITNGKNNTFLLKFKNVANIEKAVKDYVSTSLFEYVEPDYIGQGFDNYSQRIKPNDSYYKYQYQHFNDGSFKQIDAHLAKPDADVKSYLAWDITTGNENVVLAIFDSGLKMDHPEVKDRLWINKTEEANGIDSDRNGYVDDINGWNFIHHTNDPSDDQGHGTAVASVAMATSNNNIGMAGMDWKCKVMTLKVLSNERSYYSSSLAEAIYYAVDNGAHIANMSLGSSGKSKAIEDAVNYALEKGMLIVAAMGNDDDDSPFYPAAYKNTLAVGATHPDDIRVSKNTEDWGSNYGEHIDVVAPGSAILGMSYTSNTTFNQLFSGTSMASPIVAGLACLLKGQDMSRSPLAIAGIIRNTAEDLTGESVEDTEGWDSYYGYGRINAFKAVSYNLEPYEVIKIGEIFPNPANKDNGVLTLPLFGNLSDEYDLTITDSNGKIWGEYSVVFKGLNVQIQVSREIGAGVYFFSFKNDAKKFTKKVIFQ